MKFYDLLEPEVLEQGCVKLTYNVIDANKHYLEYYLFDPKSRQTYFLGTDDDDNLLDKHTLLNYGDLD